MTESIENPCSQCPAYHRGKGSKHCLKCPQYRDILPRYKPGPVIDNIPAEIVENLPTIAINDRLLRAIQLIDTRQATILIQYSTLDMKQREIATYHNISQARVKAIIEQAAINIKQILKQGYV